MTLGSYNEPYSRCHLLSLLMIVKVFDEHG